MLGSLLLASAPSLTFASNAADPVSVELGGSCLGVLEGSMAVLNQSLVKAQPMIVKLEEVQDRLGVAKALQLIELTTADGKARAEAEMFNDGPADLIIGIDVEGNTQGHMYLSIRDDSPEAIAKGETTIRYDGRMFLRPEEVTRKDWTLSNGMILRYRKVPPEIRKKILDFLNAGGIIKEPTCVASACHLLFEVGGFPVTPDFGKPWFPGTFLQKLASHGLLAADGQRILPEIYTINRDHETFWNNLPRWKRVLKFILPVIFNPATWGLKRFNPQG